ncbi:hypothetical protein [Ruminococcus sp.]|uniref:hypothetical protein n=1 Tax=Ruminococcus sp. TaxID=41978 RepID=UPI00388E57F2
MNESLTELLTGIGLSQDEIAVARRLEEAGQTDALQKHLRVCRCGLMDEMHRTQKKVDHLDYLIRHMNGGTAS